MSDWADDYDAEPETVFEALLEYRLFSGYGPGSFINCWPSKGIIYALPNVYNVQREFIGIDRYESSIVGPEVLVEGEDAFVQLELAIDFEKPMNYTTNNCPLSPKTRRSLVGKGE